MAAFASSARGGESKAGRGGEWRGGTWRGVVATGVVYIHAQPRGGVVVVALSKDKAVAGRLPGDILPGSSITSTEG